jgi:hypothetical protein
LAFVQKGRIDLPGGLIDETLGVKLLQDPLPFLGTESAGRGGTFGKLELRSLLFLPMTVNRRSGNSHGFTSGLHADLRDEDFNGFH